MKIRIKTAHGYLSFQPDGRLEYRERAGLWENIDVEGLELEPVHPPPGDPASGPAPAMSAAYVAAIKAELERQGVNLLGPCGAFAITKRVAWGLRARGAGLLSKAGGNNCDGYATDIVAFPDRAFDILSDGGNLNGPTWNETGVDDLAARWRPAVQP